MKKYMKILLVCIYVGLMFYLVMVMKQINQKDGLMDKRQQLVEEHNQLVTQEELVIQKISAAEAELNAANEQLKGLDAKIETAKEYQQTLKNILDENADLYQADMRVIVVNYDTERFKETEKQQNIVGEVAGAALNTILGSFFGGGVQESVQSNLDHVYSNRIDFNQDAIRWLQTSMYEVSAAASAFDGSYKQYQKMADTSVESEWISYDILLGASEENWEVNILVEEKQKLLEAMAKYRFHLQVFHELYSCILADNSYLEELQEQLDIIDVLLLKYDPEQKLGYDSATKSELLQTLMREYTYMVNNMIDGKVEDPALQQIGAEATDWEKKHKAIYNASGMKIYLYYQNGFEAYFDNEGNPLLIRSASGQYVYFYDDEVLTHSFETEENMQEMVEYVNQEYERFEEVYELY